MTDAWLNGRKQGGKAQKIEKDRMPREEIWLGEGGQRCVMREKEGKASSKGVYCSALICLIIIFITDEGHEKECEQREGLKVEQPQQQAVRRHGTSPLTQENEIKDAFSFYDSTNTGYISRQNLRSILGNFAYTKMNGKEIEDEITNVHQDK